MKEDRSVPGLSKLPLIGGLFKNKSDEGLTRELAVFVTAHLVSETGQMISEAAPAQPMQTQGFAAQPQPAPTQGFAVQPQPSAPAGDTYEERIRRIIENQPRQ